MYIYTFLYVHIYFFINIFYWVFDTVHYNIENWVWICWSGLDSNSRHFELHVDGPNFFIGAHSPPRVAIHSRNTIVRTQISCSQ